MKSGKLFVLSILLGVGFSGGLQANPEIEREIRQLQDAANAEARDAAISGDTRFSAKQSQKLFDRLKLSSGMDPGEERAGFVVCRSGQIAMGNISIPDCHVQAEAPAMVIDHCKELLRPAVFKKSKSKH